MLVGYYPSEKALKAKQNQLFLNFGFLDITAKNNGKIKKLMFSLLLRLSVLSGFLCCRKRYACLLLSVGKASKAKQNQLFLNFFFLDVAAKNNGKIEKTNA